jgi:hypothetical protein
LNRSRSTGSHLTHAFGSVTATPRHWDAVSYVSTTPVEPVAPRVRNIVCLEELNAADEITVGGSSGSIRLDHCDSCSEPALSPRRQHGSKYITPFNLRDPVAVCVTNGNLIVTSVAPAGTSKGSTTVCDVTLDVVGRIEMTANGINITGKDGFRLGLSIHDEHKKTLLHKVLHARTRGAAPPTEEQRRVTRPARPNLDRGDATPNSRRTPTASPAATTRSSRSSSAARPALGAQPGNDRDARRRLLAAELQSIKVAPAAVKATAKPRGRPAATTNK